MAAEPNCAKQHSTPAMTEDVVPGDGGTLQNVVVYLKGDFSQYSFRAATTPGRRSTRRAASIIRTSWRCRPAQPLQVVNSDRPRTISTPSPRTIANGTNRSRRELTPIMQSFAREEVAIPVKCNVHPWMKAYIAVFDNPYFQVTGKDGSFTIKNVPPGTYTVTAWHETLRLAGPDRSPSARASPSPSPSRSRPRPTRRIETSAEGQAGTLARGGRRIWPAPIAEQSAAMSYCQLRPNHNVHRFAVFTACCTFFLLIAGALVTSNDAGLSVPDWPLSYGSLTPPMVGGIFYEHGHRMIASFVGLLSIVLAVWLWRVEIAARGCAGSAWPRSAPSSPRDCSAASPFSSFLPPADLLRACHPGAAFLLHRREHRPFYQRLVGAASGLTVRDPRSPAIHALAIATAALACCN